MYKVKKPFEITLYFDNRPFLKLDAGAGVVKLRVYSRVEKKAKIKSLGVTCSESVFKSVTDLNKKPSGKNYEIISYLRNKLSNAESINDYKVCATLSEFFGELDNKTSSTNLKDAFNNRLENLTKDQVTTKSHTELSWKYLKELKNENITFYDITVAFLEKFETYLTTEKKLHKNSIKNYIKPIREIFTNAISDNTSPITVKDYPFYNKKENRKGFKIKSVNSKKTHKILTHEEIKLILDYKPINSTEKRALDFFKFSFYGFGINVLNIMSIRNEDIKGDYIFFTRNKTFKDEVQNEVSLKIRKEIKEIIEYWNTGKYYVFPFFNVKMSYEERIAKKQSVNSVNNDKLKSIAKKIGVNEKISHGWARTAYSTWMARKGVDRRKISDTLGHTDERSFKNYWKGYDDLSEIQNVYDDEF